MTVMTNPLCHHVMLPDGDAPLSNTAEDYDTFQLSHSLPFDERQIYRVWYGLLAVTAPNSLRDGVSDYLLGYQEASI
jgi:hypothetical protein